MKKLFYILIGIAVIALIATLHLHKPQVPAPNQQRVQENEDAGFSASSSNLVGGVKASDSSAEENTVGTPKRSPGNRQTVQGILLEENKKSLDLYGLVVDQYGEPVVGARVRGSIGYNISMVQSGGEFRYAETDSQGRFNFLGIHGAGIGLWPEKTGYYYNPKLPSTTRPDDYLPDPNKPLVIRMWKSRGADSLISSSMDLKIPTDGTPVSWDFTARQSATEGDLQITFNRFPQEVQRGRQKFDWNLTLQFSGGGIQSNIDPYPYWAPEGGYSPSFNINVNSNDVPWHPDSTKDFYFKNSAGKFGRMRLSVFAALSPARIKIQYWLNPSGSQNLEIEFEK